MQDSVHEARSIYISVDSVEEWANLEFRADLGILGCQTDQHIYACRISP